MFTTFEHTADLGLRVVAADLASLFAEAAQGLTSMIVANLDQVGLVLKRDFHVPGAKRDELLFDWLNEVLYAFEAEHLLFAHFDVRVGGTGLHATAHGEVLDLDRHQLEHEVKAITYHGLKVEPNDGGWLAEVIVDI
jgi:SHS2 domain-containing protein